MPGDYGGQTMVEPLRRVLVKRPEAAFAVGDPALWHYAGRPDLDEARREHDALVAILCGAGAEVIDHPEPQTGRADAIFVFDPALQDVYVQQQRFPATPGMVRFVNTARALGITVFGLTGRNDGQKAATVANLTKVGYGANPPDPRWPGGAKLAVNFVMNYEEGSEPSVQDGEGHSETGHTESHGGAPVPKGRDLAAEGMFEYGSRVGFWRLLRLFQDRGLPMTVFGCALALERNPEAAAAIRAAIDEAGYEAA